MSPEYWTALEAEINRQLVISQDAQHAAEDVIRRALDRFGAHVEYRVWFLPRTAKTRGRAIEKARRVVERQGEIAVGEVLQQINDFAAGRVLVVGIKDLQLAHDHLRVALTSDSCWLDGEPEGYVEAAKAGGFRGLKQRLRVAVRTDGYYPFELQLMTYLQHSWDQLQHTAYERTRSGLSIPDEVVRKFESLSDRLYELDLVFDSLRSGYSASS